MSCRNKAVAGLMTLLAALAVVTVLWWAVPAWRGAHPRPAADGRPAAEPPLPGHVSFNRDVAPIVFDRCAGCHRPGASGPFPLLSYADAKKRAGQIADLTGRRVMPPWLPE